MQVVHERCAGLDVHKKTVVVCALTPEGRETRSFGTMTEELWELAGWLEEKGIGVVAMESTGVYWKPIFNLLEALELEVLLVNAQHIKAVPGRKTDVKDAEWIADLLRHGLLRGSFVPDRAGRELRELVRYRRSLIQERAREVNRLQKVLEGCNIKLAAVASDVMGRSGRAMLRGLIEGTLSPEKLAGLARGRLRAKQGQLQQALQGVVGTHQRWILAEQLGHIEDLEARIERASAEVAERLVPFAAELQLLQTIPGVGRRVAEDWLTETGVEMGRFPTHRHLASWTRICPGNHRSAGKQTGSGSTGKGNRWLRSTLVEAAWGVARQKKTNYLSAQYWRLKARLGPQQAIVAVAHSILVIGYHVLQQRTPYRDLGVAYFDQRARNHVIRSTCKRLEQLGLEVTIREKTAA